MFALSELRSWAGRIKQDAVALGFAYRDPRTPLLVKALCIFVVAYALSPIDLIPDFIPVLGHLDDVLLLPALIGWAVRLVPEAAMEDARIRARERLAMPGRKPRSYVAATVIVALWLGVAALTGYLGCAWLQHWHAC